MQNYRKFTNASGGSATAVSGPTPGTSTDNAIARWDGTDGRLIQNSTVIIDDTGNITGPSGGMTVTGGTAASNNLLLRSTSNATKGRIILEDNSSSGVGLDGGTTTSQVLKVYAYDTAFWAGVQAGTIKSFPTNSTNPNFILTANDSGNYIGIYDGTNDPRVLFTRSTNAENAHNSGISNPASGVLRITDGSTGYGFLQTAGFKRKTADQTVTDSTTLVNDTHLTVSLAAGRSYGFKFVLFVTEVATSGLKLALAGTATHTNIIADTTYWPIGDVGILSRATSATTIYDVVSGFTASQIIIEGTTTVNAAGTFLVQFAQSVETGAAETATLLRGSRLECWDIA